MPAGKSQSRVQQDLLNTRVADAIEEVRTARSACSIEDLTEVVAHYRNVKFRPNQCRPLTRDEIMALLDYLEASVFECNRVLENAGYEPVMRYVTGAELKQHLP